MFVCKIKGYTREVRKYIKFRLSFVQILTKGAWNYSLISRVYHSILHTNIFLPFILNNHLFAPNIGKKNVINKSIPYEITRVKNCLLADWYENNNKK